VDPTNSPYVTAIQQGNSYADIAQYHTDNELPMPDRPAMQDIVNGSWQQTFGANMNQPGRDAINEGAGPIGEALIAGAAGGVVGAIKGAVAAGTDTAITQSSRAAAMGVSTSTDEAAVGSTAYTASDTADEIANLMKYPLAAGAAGVVMEGGLGEGLAKGQ
jgi:hypothetical protein